MQGIFELFFLLGFLGLGLGCLSFLCRFLKAGEEAFFLLGRGFQIAADAFDTDYVKSADLCLDLFLHRDQVEYLLICDKNGNLRTNLSLNDGKLGTAKKLRSLVNDHLWETGFLKWHSLLINNEHGNGLFACFDLCLLFFLFLLGLLAKEIQTNQ